MPLSHCWTPHPDRKLVLPPHTFVQSENNSDKETAIKTDEYNSLQRPQMGEMVPKLHQDFWPHVEVPVSQSASAQYAL